MKRQLLLGTLGALVLIAVTSVTTFTRPGDLIVTGDEEVRVQLQDVEGNPIGEVRVFGLTLEFNLEHVSKTTISEITLRDLLLEGV
jgi:hypothetical protein